MTIKEASEKTGISVDNLRYYERIGLIPEVPRSASKIRNYDDVTLSWIDFVMRFKRGGMALESIREYVQLAMEGEETKPARKEILLETKEQLEIKLVEIWLLVGHLGIMGHDHIMVSLANAHYTNKGIKETKKLSVAIVDEAMLTKADYVGCVSGAKEDKSGIFAYHMSDSGVPIMDEAPVVMECSVEDIYQTQGFESFICTIDHVYAEEQVINGQGKLDYHTLKPVLFEMPTYEYLRTGDIIGKCMKIGKEEA